MVYRARALMQDSRDAVIARVYFLDELFCSNECVLKFGAGLVESGVTPPLVTKITMTSTEVPIHDTKNHY